MFLSKYGTLKLSEIHNPHPFFIVPKHSVLAEDSRALRFGKGIRRLLHGFLGVLGFSGGTSYATSVGIAPGMIWALPHIYITFIVQPALSPKFSSFNQGHCKKTPLPTFLSALLELILKA